MFWKNLGDEPRDATLKVDMLYSVWGSSNFISFSFFPQKNTGSPDLNGPFRLCGDAELEFERSPQYPGSFFFSLVFLEERLVTYAQQEQWMAWHGQDHFHVGLTGSLHSTWF
jgi:hypothetical protein